jgi:hypothetical protein
LAAMRPQPANASLILRPVMGGAAWRIEETSRKILCGPATSTTKTPWSTWP